MGGPALLASVSRIAATGHGMFGLYDEEDGGSGPVHPHGWHAATARTVHIYPACQLPSPGVRFEQWTTGPPRQVADSGDDPEVRARLKFQVTHPAVRRLTLERNPLPASAAPDEAETVTATVVKRPVTADPVSAGNQPVPASKGRPH